MVVGVLSCWSVVDWCCLSSSSAALMVPLSPCVVLSSPVGCSTPVSVSFGVISLSESVASVLFLLLLSIFTVHSLGYLLASEAPLLQTALL